MLHTVVCVRAYHFTWQGFVGPMPHWTSEKTWRWRCPITVLRTLLLLCIEIVKQQFVYLFNADFDMVVVPHEIATLTLIRKDEYWKSSTSLYRTKLHSFTNIQRIRSWMNKTVPSLIAFEMNSASAKIHWKYTTQKPSFFFNVWGQHLTI